MVLATSFPFSALLAQHKELSAAAAQLSRVRQENSLLVEQEHQLSSTAEIQRLARQDYQLVSPGQSLFDILPPASTPATAAPSGATTGDPGNQPLVAPANAPDMFPDPGLPNTPSSGGTGQSGAPGSSTSGSTSSGGVGSPRAPSSFWSRVTNTLEFWK